MDAAPSRRWDLLPLLGFIALAGLLAWRWPLLPERLATHFDALGRPNGWTPKPAIPYVVLGVPLTLWGMFLLITRTSSRHLPALGALLVPFRNLFSLGVQCVFGDLLIQTEGPGWGTGIGIGLILGGAVLMATRAFKATRALPPDPRYRGGAFFYDPADPRLLVPKRLGLGWTFNFGRPMAWLLMAILLALPLAAWRLSQP